MEDYSPYLNPYDDPNNVTVLTQTFTPLMSPTVSMQQLSLLGLHPAEYHMSDQLSPISGPLSDDMMMLMQQQNQQQWTLPAAMSTTKPTDKPKSPRFSPYIVPKRRPTPSPLVNNFQNTPPLSDVTSKSSEHSPQFGPTTPLLYPGSSGMMPITPSQLMNFQDKEKLKPILPQGESIDPNALSAKSNYQNLMEGNAE